MAKKIVLGGVEIRICATKSVISQKYVTKLSIFVISKFHITRMITVNL